MPYDTLEQAQERILELEEEVENNNVLRETLSQDNENLKSENERLRTLNQKYFNKLIAQEKDEQEEEEHEEVPTCEEFACNLKF